MTVNGGETTVAIGDDGNGGALASFRVTGSFEGWELEETADGVTLRLAIEPNDPYGATDGDDAVVVGGLDQAIGEEHEL